MTTRPNVLYRFWNAKDQLLYVGITVNPGSRWQTHERDKAWWADVARVTVEHFPDRTSVEAAEREAIRTERPLHNITHSLGHDHFGDHPACRMLAEKTAIYLDLVDSDPRGGVAAAVVAALKAEIPPSVVTAHSPFTATHVRNIGKAAGIPPAPPGIKPKKKV